MILNKSIELLQSTDEVLGTVQHFKDQYLNVDYYKDFLFTEEISHLLSFCEQYTQNSPDYMRSNLMFGDEGLIYSDTYQGKTYHTKAIIWPTNLIHYKNKVEKTTGHIYNFCSLMKYPNGKIGIKKHRDKEMTSGTSICGISVGAMRKIQFSPTNYVITKCDNIILELTSGSLYCMLPPTNDLWLHEILPDFESMGVRYSLTFRNVNTENIPKEIPPKQICQAILKSGKRRGEECGIDTHYRGNRCGKHSNC